MSDNSSAQVAVADSGLFPDSTKPCVLIAFAFKCLFHCRLNECVVITNAVFCQKFSVVNLTVSSLYYFYLSFIVHREVLNVIF